MGALAYKSDVSEPPSLQHHQSAHPGFRPDHRRQIRLAELEQVISILPRGARVLEIGAGAGWQARTLAERGFDVVAIEIESSNYNSLREWDIQTYDGMHIPLQSKSVDVVFSSNVLEHIPHIADFQKEIQRVLRSGGISIHVMPTSTWRIYTSVGFYFHRAIQILRGILGKSSSAVENQVPKEAPIQRRGTVSISARLRRLFFPPTHGVRGNFVTEALYFSEFFWEPLFVKTDWDVREIKGNGLLYTGFRIFGPKISLHTRQRLSRFLGSSCKIYVLRSKVRSD